MVGASCIVKACPSSHDSCEACLLLANGLGRTVQRQAWQQDSCQDLQSHDVDCLSRYYASVPYCIVTHLRKDAIDRRDANDAASKGYEA